MIETEGYLTVGNTHMVGPYFTEEAARSLHIEYLTTYDIPSVSAGILGLNLTHPSALELLNRWHMAAKDPHAFFSPRDGTWQQKTHMPFSLHDQIKMFFLFFSINCR
jgi:hypothetical protein